MGRALFFWQGRLSHREERWEHTTPSCVLLRARPLFTSQRWRMDQDNLNARLSLWRIQRALQKGYAPIFIRTRSPGMRKQTAFFYFKFCAWRKSGLVLELTLLKYTLYTINYTHFMYTGCFDKWIHLCNLHPNQDVEHLHHPPKFPRAHLQSVSATSTPGNHGAAFYHHRLVGFL